eukprot:11944236-Alexandrium_andersonii.AAC.1
MSALALPELRSLAFGAMGYSRTCSRSVAVHAVADYSKASSIISVAELCAHVLTSVYVAPPHTRPRRLQSSACCFVVGLGLAGGVGGSRCQHSFRVLKHWANAQQVVWRPNHFWPWAGRAAIEYMVGLSGLGVDRTVAVA